MIVLVSMNLGGGEKTWRKCGGSWTDSGVKPRKMF